MTYIALPLIIAVAGHETTANLLGAAVIHLSTPDVFGLRPFVGDVVATRGARRAIAMAVATSARTG